MIDESKHGKYNRNERSTVSPHVLAENSCKLPEMNFLVFCEREQVEVIQLKQSSFQDGGAMYYALPFEVMTSWLGGSACTGLRVVWV
jgi:hypothetical protein